MGSSLKAAMNMLARAEESAIVAGWTEKLIVHLYKVDRARIVAKLSPPSRKI